jgi:hypothetical protein
MAPVPVTEITCHRGDGSNYHCIGKLVRESHSPAYSLVLKSEILGLGRRELGRPVERRGVPTGSVLPGGGYDRELSALNKTAMP